ncbi:hypothetical protein B0A48_05823 [Cryoendolithus antarcticus]|uniref:DUF221-domain-containing protein n=1 Tax=Cryoendolithus antarcticus TaxID=1507870 RepID=A0A1V8TC22_9PEZI|nr:hypothetical protein B0A48_05823 [Cryoendolithus antarcticus]
MLETLASDHGGHRSSSSSSGHTILAAFIPTFTSALLSLGLFLILRNRFLKHYAPRTFLGTVPEKDRTPATSPTGQNWFNDFWSLHNPFVLQHSALDAYLYLRFLKFIVFICGIGCLITFPVLLPANLFGVGKAEQLDALSFSNVDDNSVLWAHTAVAWVLFLAVTLIIARERLVLIGTRQAYLLGAPNSEKLSAKTVLFLNAPRDALLPGNLKSYFGEHAKRSWPVKDAGDLEQLVEQRKSAAMDLESAEFDLIARGVKSKSSGGNSSAAENGNGGAVPKAQRPSTRQPLLVGKKHDAIEFSRSTVADLAEKITSHRASPARGVPGQSGVFVTFDTQPAAHRAFETLSFKSPRIPIEDRYLAVAPKEVLWSNLARPVSVRMSKASLGLAFVIAFSIFFSIPVGLIGTLSNVQYLADQYSWLNWINDMPDWMLSLMTGLLPPFLVSWFVSYVPKLFRHVAKLSGEPTAPQAELKTQAWYFSFQVFQIFLVTTFSSGAAAVASQIIQNPQSAPDLLASSVPKASNFYLTYFLIQGLTSAASNVLNSSDLMEYLFYQHFWNKTPREQFTEYSRMKGISYGSLFPKFTNLLVIAIAYSCIAPLVLGFATVGLALYYLSYRYNLLYVCQSKIDTKGEMYKRALQQMMTGIYLAELSLIGLFSARKAAIQTVLIIVLLIITAILNLVLDRVLRPLELYLGVDTWQEAEIPLLADEENIDPNDEVALHTAAHNRRLGLDRLPKSTSNSLSQFFDSYIQSSREQVKVWLNGASAREEDVPKLSDEDYENAYENPAFTTKTPKLWLPRDAQGVSKQEIEENDRAGIKSTDEGASIDKNGKLSWEHDFEKVPIFSKPKVT